MFIIPLENTPYQWLSLLWYRIRPVSSICGHWSSEWPVWLLLLKETFILLIKFSFHYWWSLWPAEVWAGSFFPRKSSLGPPPLPPLPTTTARYPRQLWLSLSPKSRMERAGHFWSPCSERHLHPCLATLCFYSERAFVTSVIGSSPAGAPVSSRIRRDFAPSGVFLLVYSPSLRLVYVPGDARVQHAFQ